MGSTRNAWMGRLWGLAAIAAPMFSGAVACGGDDSGGGGPSSGGSGGTPGSGGTTSSTGGTASSGGSSGLGGSGAAGGSGGSGGVGGSGGSVAVGGSGGSGVGGSGGSANAGGSAGGGGAPAEGFAPITKVVDGVLDEANEIRGLTYSASGNIWGSGFTDADPENRQLVLVRLTADGELDSSFADGGVLVFDIAPGDEQSRGIVELANGDIIVQANIDDQNGGELIADAGNVEADQPRPDGRDVVLLRFDADGALVTSFGDEGIATIDFGWTEADHSVWPVPSYDSTVGGWSGAGFPTDDSWGIALDTSGDEEKIVVFGYGPPVRNADANAQRFDNDRYVARVLASDGSADPDFNDGSAFTFTSPGEFSDGGRRGIVEADGSIVSAGYTNFGQGFGNHVILLRLLEDGTADADFGFGIAVPGATRFNPFIDDGGVAECYAVGRQSNGRLVTTGYGAATAPNMTSKYGYATSQAQDLVSFGVLPGGLDLDWGNQGTLAIQSEEAGLGDAQDRGRDLVVLEDDRVVHAGRFGPNPALFVTTPEGQLDTSVGDGGKFTYEPFVDTSHFYVIAANASKTRIAAATSNHPDGVIVAILEVQQD